MVGRGGYSEVYKGVLCDGETIAVKRLAKDNNDPNKERDFLMELGVIGHVCHPNTATLLGYCIENGLYLIFNYSQNGNLSTALHGYGEELLFLAVTLHIENVSDVRHASMSDNRHYTDVWLHSITCVL
jgi:serine/threonine protein kinase